MDDPERGERHPDPRQLELVEPDHEPGHGGARDLVEGERAQLRRGAEVVEATREQVEVAFGGLLLLSPSGRLGEGEGDEAREAQRHRQEQHRPAHPEPRGHHGAEKRAGEDPRQLRRLEPRHDPGRLGLAPQGEERVVGKGLVGAREERDGGREQGLGDHEHGEVRDAPVKERGAGEQAGAPHATETFRGQLEEVPLEAVELRDRGACSRGDSGTVPRAPCDCEGLSFRPRGTKRGDGRTPFEPVPSRGASCLQERGREGAER